MIHRQTFIPHYPFIDTQSIFSTWKGLEHIHHHLFPDARLERKRLQFFCEEIQRLYKGGFSGFQAADTPYHSLEHTLQVVVCLARLLQGAIIRGEKNLSAEAFERALVAAFFHDVGYFKQVDDADGTGAKYTAHHEIRGALMAGTYLAKRKWSIYRIVSVQKLIFSTASARAIQCLLFDSVEEHFLAQALCTADIVAQMSDPFYLKRLPQLQLELAESQAFLAAGGAVVQHAHSMDELFKETLSFWQHVLDHKLTLDCGGVYTYLAIENGLNPYLIAIEKHMQAIRSWLKAQQQGNPFDYYEPST